jgi:HAD superfamily 5'-nucleotidase-like hydrolase
LKSSALEAVGFDMDFTLAQYNEAFDLLAFEGAKKKLCENLGYPKEVLDFKYDANQFRRGLIIDKSKGNILKVDRHKYVRKVYHGFREMTPDERKSLYGTKVTSFTDSNYVNIDTLFLLIDALLFTNLVEFKDSNPSVIPKSYEQIYKDVRSAVDLCHRDGVIKDVVMSDPKSYIIYDEGLVPMLQRLQKSGKKVFLLTNSLWEYTNSVMNYLVHGNNNHHSNLEWESLFDIVIVGGCKPAFLTDNYLSLFRVHKSGALRNIEDKDSLQLSELDKNSNVFQGGNWKDLHRMLSISSGDKILYVGDHMYADILRSKRTLGWRTCLVIPELENEIIVAQAETILANEILKLRQLQYDLDEYIDLLRLRLRMGVNTAVQLNEAQVKAEELKLRLRNLTDEYNSKFNLYWGQLFKAGFQDSRFAKQVMDYACLYTSRATNLGKVSPDRSFRPVQDFMPHDQMLFDTDRISNL